MSLSPASRDLNLSTTVNSSDVSRLPSAEGSSKLINIPEADLISLKRKIQKLECKNHQLWGQVRNWKAKYQELKQQREQVKTQVVEDIRTKLFDMQSKSAQSEELSLKNELKDLKEKYNETLTENSELSQKLEEVSSKLLIIREDQKKAVNTFAKKENMMKFALNHTMKTKLNEPMIKYLIGTVCKNPLSLARYFNNSNHTVVRFLNF